MKKTKIVATLGPATYGSEKILEMYEAGVNVIRFNFSHADYEGTLKQLEIINELNDSGKTNLSTLLDTKGPEIRTGDLAEKIKYKAGDVFKIFTDESKRGSNDLYCDYSSLPQDVEVGGVIAIDSGLFDVKVLELGDSFVLVEALNDSIIGSKRHINLPGVKLRLPGITDKDKQDIDFAIKNNFDFIAASFIRSSSNVEEIRSILDKNNSNIKIISKIENQEGIDNMDEIIVASNGVMVARGDLGIEVPVKKLPIYQNQMIEKARTNGKMVIVATHFLESMIENPFPTRAESSDVFNTVLQKPDSLMLSGETAMGQFPIKSISMMSKIIEEAETVIKTSYTDYLNDSLNPKDIEKKVLIKNALRTGEELGAKAIIILTKTGKLARITSLYKPQMPIYAFTGSIESVKYMNLMFGVESNRLSSWEKGNFDLNLDLAVKSLHEETKIKNDDLIIAINDIPKNGEEISMMSIFRIGEFLA